MRGRLVLLVGVAPEAVPRPLRWAFMISPTAKCVEPAPTTHWYRSQPLANKGEPLYTVCFHIIGTLETMRG